MADHLPHLLFKQSESYHYTSRVAGGGKKRRPPRNRFEHGEFLTSRLEKAWEEAEQDQVVFHATRHGVYLEFKGEAGFDLATRSLENLRGKDPSNWARLLNIRRIKSEEESGSETMFATVFVPHGKKELFFNLLERYAKEESKRNIPKHAQLVESISDIRSVMTIDPFWVDTKDLIPSKDPEWCEVWIRTPSDTAISDFEQALEEHQLNTRPGVIRFPERTVKIVEANASQIEGLIRHSDLIAEIRRAKQTAAFWLDSTPSEQTEWVQDILDRLEVESHPRVAICLLDTGVNRGHPLLEPLLNEADCQSFDSEWGSHDHDKHGTLMAGVAAYGDFQIAMEHNETISIEHGLESVKVLPPRGINEPHLWGHVTAQSIYRAELQAPDRSRIICSAITAEDTRDIGRPSSWSAELDQLCSGVDDEIRRLIIVSSGNASENGPYPDAQLTDSIHDPAQSWNALTVGAYTCLDHISDSQMEGYQAIAPSGGLSPFTTTSLVWENRWPIKPDIVMEGGNLASDASGFQTECDDLSLISTYYQPQRNHFYPFNMTSAASARAAWFAAQVQTKYPDYWPETIRALMVHSATWTETLQRQFIKKQNKGDYERLLRICGYGVPNIERALYSASNSLTLISQSELQPFEKKGNRYCTKEMHFYDLPWPQDILLSLGETIVNMRVTLSYFIEPGPGEIGWKDRYRYSSHGLRFELNSASEAAADFMGRINAEASDIGAISTKGPSKHWKIGQARNHGSIHSDIWEGTASELATSNLLAIYPAIGWWRERVHLGRWDKQARYALIVSIHAPEQEIDLYTPIASRIQTSISV